jgi:hypothetical protein
VQLTLTPLKERTMTNLPEPGPQNNPNGHNPAAVPTALHGLAQLFLDTAPPDEDFWTWLERSADAVQIIAMERRRRARGTWCDECFAAVAPEESRGIPPWTYCVGCALGDGELLDEELLPLAVRWALSDSLDDLVRSTAQGRLADRGPRV